MRVTTIEQKSEDEIIRHCKMLLKHNSKIVIYSPSISRVHKIYRLLEKYNPVIVDGSTKTTDRKNYLEKFSKDEKCRIFIMTMFPVGIRFPVVSFVFIEP